MNAIDALRDARRAGVHVTIDGEDLVLEAPMRPPSHVLDALWRHKPSIIGLLQPEADGWTGEDWHVYFDERAGIAEFDGGLSRNEAEAQAFACCIVEWLNRNPAQSAPGRCLGCGGPDRPNDPLLPFGTDTDKHAWLHSACWPPWHRTRRAGAIAALTAFDIRPPTNAPAFAQGGKGD